MTLQQLRKIRNRRFDLMLKEAISKKVEDDNLEEGLEYIDLNEEDDLDEEQGTKPELTDADVEAMLAEANDKSKQDEEDSEEKPQPAKETKSGRKAPKKEDNSELDESFSAGDVADFLNSHLANRSSKFLVRESGKIKRLKDIHFVNGKCILDVM